MDGCMDGQEIPRWATNYRCGAVGEDSVVFACGTQIADSLPISMAKTSFIKRLSYAGSDTAGQLVFSVISFYILKFYTDVFGIAAATAGTILLVARCVDAIDAPVWGIIFEKTHSKWGKSRPWFLWLCVPFAVFGVLTFLTPDLSHGAKVAYAAVTYIICSVLYTGINT